MSLEWSTKFWRFIKHLPEKIGMRWDRRCKSCAHFDPTEHGHCGDCRLGVNNSGLDDTPDVEANFGCVFHQYEEEIYP